VVVAGRSVGLVAARCSSARVQPPHHPERVRKCLYGTSLVLFGLRRRWLRVGGWYDATSACTSRYDFAESSLIEPSAGIVKRSVLGREEYPRPQDRCRQAHIQSQSWSA